MKPDIEVGGIYANAAGCQCKVLTIGKHPGIAEIVTYLVLNAPTHTNGRSTMKRFRQWAVRRVDGGDNG